LFFNFFEAASSAGAWPAVALSSLLPGSCQRGITRRVLGRPGGKRLDHALLLHNELFHRLKFVF